MACATMKRSLDLDWEPVSSKRRRCAPLCTSPSHTNLAGNSSTSSPRQNSAFPEVMGRILTLENMADSIKEEMKRMQRRREFRCGVGNVESLDGESSQSDRPLFTFKQVVMICERMLREKEAEIRHEYDLVLSAKLAEQYESFSRFTSDQLHRNYTGAPPSYLS